MISSRRVAISFPQTKPHCGGFFIISIIKIKTNFFLPDNLFWFLFYEQVQSEDQFEHFCFFRDFFKHSDLIISSYASLFRKYQITRSIRRAKQNNNIQYSSSHLKPLRVSKQHNTCYEWHPHELLLAMLTQPAAPASSPAKDRRRRLPQPLLRSTEAGHLQW